jgi:hypothetical protein
MFKTQINTMSQVTKQNNVSSHAIIDDSFIKFEMEIILTEDTKSSDLLTSYLHSDFIYKYIINYLDFSSSNHPSTLIAESIDFFIDLDFEECSFDEDRKSQAYYADFEKHNQSITIGNKIYKGGLLGIEIDLTPDERRITILFKNKSNLSNRQVHNIESKNVKF